MKKDGFKFLRDWRDYARTLSNEDYRKFVEAVNTYAFEGEFPQGLPPEVEHYFFTKVLPVIENIGKGCAR